MCSDSTVAFIVKTEIDLHNKCDQPVSNFMYILQLLVLHINFLFYIL